MFLYMHLLYHKFLPFIQIFGFQVVGLLTSFPPYSIFSFWIFKLPILCAFLYLFPSYPFPSSIYYFLSVTIPDPIPHSMSPFLIFKFLISISRPYLLFSSYIEYRSYDVTKNFFWISLFWIPCIGGAWWKTSTAQIWWELVLGGPRYGCMNT